MVSLYFISTPKCQLLCPHCHVEAGPERRGPEIGTLRRIVDHLPIKLEHLEITGGDPMSDPATTIPLLSMLSERVQQGSLAVKGIMVQTNGVFLVEPTLDETAEQLDFLSRNRVRVVDITLPINQLKQLARRALFAGLDSPEAVAQRYVQLGSERLEALGFTTSIKIVTPAEACLYSKKGHLSVKIVTEAGLSHLKHMPIGRAAGQTADHLRFGCDHWLTRGRVNLTIDYTGNVYLCCFRGFKLGSLLEHSFEMVLELARRNEQYREVVDYMLAEGGKSEEDVAPAIPCQRCSKGGEKA